MTTTKHKDVKQTKNQKKHIAEEHNIMRKTNKNLKKINHYYNNIYIYIYIKIYKNAKQGGGA